MTDVLAKPKFALEAFSTVARLQMEAWKVSSEARLTNAKAELEQAKTEYANMVTDDLAQQVRAKQTVVDRLQLEYKRLAENEHRARRRIEQVERAVKDANYLYQGQHLSAGVVANAWIGFLFLLVTTPKLTADLIDDVATDEEKAGKSFSHNSKPGEVCPDAGSDVVTVLDLIHWARRKSLMPRSGSAASQRILGVVGKLGELADTEVNETQAAIEKLRSGVLKDFSPTTVLALPNPAIPQ